MTHAIDTTVPTTHRTSNEAQRGRRISRGRRWALAVIATVAMAGTVAFTPTRPDEASTRSTTAESQAATNADLAYANEWARRLQAMTTAESQAR